MKWLRVMALPSHHGDQRVDHDRADDAESKEFCDAVGGEGFDNHAPQYCKARTAFRPPSAEVQELSAR